MVFVLKKFQEDAIIDLRRQFLELWQTGNRRINLVFKAPTGSGKTIIMAQFLKELVGDPQFDADKAFLWFAFSPDSYVQSKNKISNYYDGAGEINLLDLNDLNKKKLEKNNVFFINWQKIKSSTKEGKKLRKDSEKSEFEKGIFDEFIIKSKTERELIVIIDEAHIETDTDLSQEIIDLIDPKIIIHVTATPKKIPDVDLIQDKKAGYVRVKREDVILEGLIKEKIITQTKEDLDKISLKELDQDNILLELAYNKRIELLKSYKKINIDYINPLVLIQLPNDDRARKETNGLTKEQLVKIYLKEKGVKDHEIAVWLSENKENKEGIEKHNSEVSFLIFKQAAATGWDCPRAQILVMFREIKNPTFHTQTVGRILRMPEAKHYDDAYNLNISYLYTNYERNQIKLPESKSDNNKPFLYTSFREDFVKPFYLKSTFLSRTDYNDLGASFQKSFENIADNYFNIKDGFTHGNSKKLIDKGIEMKSPKISNKLIINAEIESYDEFVEDIKKSGQDFEKEISTHDLERTYELLCFNIILHQEEDKRKFAPERSWGRLKSALNVWFSKRIDQDSEIYYKIIVNDLLKENSVLKKVISSALEYHKPIRNNEVKEKETRKESSFKLEIPVKQMYFTEDYENIYELNSTLLSDKIKINKSAIQPFYIKKNYSGKVNELNFVRYLENSKSVDWWYKQNDSGKDMFAIKYFNPEENKESLFYPDWIVKLKNDKILILDTKQGATVKSSDTKYKAEALQNWIKNNNKSNIQGGIISQISEIWKINKKENYIYDGNYSQWENLDDFLIIKN